MAVDQLYSPRSHPWLHFQEQGKPERFAFRYLVDLRRGGRTEGLVDTTRCEDSLPTMLEELKARLDGEIEKLTHELQVVLPKAIEKAVEHGDLRENSEYKSALERQQFVQARLGHLTKRRGELSNVDLNDIPADRVGFGSRVTVRDLKTNDEETYSLVFGDYIDIDTGQISMASPLGQNLLGKQVGDEVSLQLPRGERKLKVESLTTLHEMVG